MQVHDMVVAATVLLVVVLMFLLLSTRPNPDTSAPTNWDLLFAKNSKEGARVRNIVTELARKEGARVRVADTTSAEGMCARDNNGYRVRVTQGMEGFGGKVAGGRVLEEESLGISVPFYGK